jgi:hypothetical protein
MKLTFLFALTLISTILPAQDKSLPYYEIPAEPDHFTAGTVASRIVDGLGFRYYWATEGLRPEDLSYEPNQDARTVEETIVHIYDLSTLVVNATSKTPNVARTDKPKLSFADLRKKTLENLKAASDRLRSATDQEMNEFKIVFVRGSDQTTFPFWNNLNGPIADALWHVGQVVSFRRSSGNPFTDKVSVFTGKVRP